MPSPRSTSTRVTDRAVSILSVIALALALALAGCNSSTSGGSGGGGTPPGNAPTVSITTPSNNASVGDGFTVTATATAPAGSTISEVDFYTAESSGANKALASKDTKGGDGWSATITGVSSGTSIKVIAQAVDSSGTKSADASITVSIIPNPATTYWNNLWSGSPPAGVDVSPLGANGPITGTDSNGNPIQSQATLDLLHTDLANNTITPASAQTYIDRFGQNGIAYDEYTVIYGDLKSFQNLKGMGLIQSDAFPNAWDAGVIFPWYVDALMYPSEFSSKSITGFDPHPGVVPTTFVNFGTAAAPLNWLGFVGYPSCNSNVESDNTQAYNFVLDNTVVQQDYNNYVPVYWMLPTKGKVVNIVQMWNPVWKSYGYSFYIQPIQYDKSVIPSNHIVFINTHITNTDLDNDGEVNFDDLMVKVGDILQPAHYDSSGALVHGSQFGILNVVRGNRELDLIIESADWGYGPHLGWDQNGYNVEMFWDYQGAFPNLPHSKHLLMNNRAYRRPIGPGIHPTGFSYAMLNPCNPGVNAPQ